MPNKIVVLIISIVFGINIQTVSAQTDEKWLPSSMTVYSNAKEDKATFHFKYDEANRLNEVETILNLSQTIIRKRKNLKYDSYNNPIKLISYISINDSIISEYESMVNTSNNKIEIKNGSYYIGILHLDEKGKFLTKLEETTNDSIQTKHVITTFEYRNNVLYKRKENTLVEFLPKEVEGKNEYDHTESKAESTSHIYDIKTNKQLPFNNLQPRWLLAYFKIEDVIVFPAIKISSSDPDKGIMPEMDISYHYNTENYLTGWTIIDSESGERTHCNIEYTKVK